MSNIIFTEQGWADYLYWQLSDKVLLRKTNELLRDIIRAGANDGIGKPEALRYRKAWSRRIDQKNRLIYSINDDGNIIVYSCRGHYDD